MSARVPLRRAVLLDTLNSDEVVEGYHDGRKNEPEPGGNRSFSYWHGWRNGMADGYHAEPDDAQREMAHDVIETGYLRNLRAVA